MKGRYAFAFVDAADRVTVPMARDGGRWREVSWDDAIAFVAERLAAIRDTAGPAARRQHQRRREDGAEVDLADQRPSAIEEILDEELRASLLAMIAETSQRDRAALSALLLGAKPTGEAARKRRFRAIERLRSMWRKAHD